MNEVPTQESALARVAETIGPDPLATLARLADLFEREPTRASNIPLHAVVALEGCLELYRGMTGCLAGHVHRPGDLDPHMYRDPQRYQKKALTQRILLALARFIGSDGPPFTNVEAMWVRDIQIAGQPLFLEITAEERFGWSDDEPFPLAAVARLALALREARAYEALTWRDWAGFTGARAGAVTNAMQPRREEGLDVIMSLPEIRSAGSFAFRTRHLPPWMEGRCGGTRE